MKTPRQYRRHLGGLEACKMQAARRSEKDGAILGIVMVVLLLISVLILVLFNVGRHSGREAVYELKRAQAFWLAEAGVQKAFVALKAGGRLGWPNGGISGSEVGEGTYAVVEGDNQNTNFTAYGMVSFGGGTITNRINFNAHYIIPGFDNAVDGEGQGGSGDPASSDWVFMLRGTRVGENDGPVAPGYDDGYHPGGNDVVLGIVDVYGTVRLFDQSRIKDLGGSYNIGGDVHSVSLNDNTRIDGGYTATSSIDYDPLSLADMDYPNSADWNIAELFADEGRNSGRLPQGKYYADDAETIDLHDLVVKNVSPGGEHIDTEGDDYFFHPLSESIPGEEAALGTGDLELGNKTYYVDGHVWFHSDDMHEFRVDGQATIVSSYDIHISEDLVYKERWVRDAVMNGQQLPLPGRNEETSDLLALVALGRNLDADGRPGKFGDVFFGDPQYGYTANVDGFMFANNNFHYNIDAMDPCSDDLQEPKCGFKVFGNFMAMNQVVVNRDWYTRGTYQSGEETRYAIEGSPNCWYDAETGAEVPSSIVLNEARRAAEYEYDETSNLWKWVDLLDDKENHVDSSIRHYAMQVMYDDRVRDFARRLDGLPSGDGKILKGIYDWQEIP